MSYAELVQLYFERSNSLQWYWTIYVIVIGGLLAFASLRKERDRSTTILITVLFCFFAYKNLGAIHDVILQRIAILDAIQHLQLDAPVTRLLQPILVQPPFEGVRNFHALSDLLTVAALWAMELRRKRAAPAREQASTV